MRPTSVFIWNSALREKFNLFSFRRFLIVLIKFSFEEETWALSNNFYEFLAFFLTFPNFLRFQFLSPFATREAIRISQVIINNHTLFVMKGKFGQPSKVSKYYDHDFLQNFCLFFMSSLFVKSSHILSGIYFIFLNNYSTPNLKGFQYQVWTSVKRSVK